MSRFEIRCHESGDDSDYHWGYHNSREEAQNAIDDFYRSRPDTCLYEHLYTIEA